MYMSDGLKNLVSKIRRLHAAVGSATELDYKKFPPKLFVTQHAATLRQDFNAGLSDEELLNLAFQVIRSIADLKDYLRSAAKGLQQDPDDVDRAINNCLELALMMDLANSDKHSRLPRAREQWSKKSPSLTEVKRVLQIVGKGIRPGSMMSLRMTPQGMVPHGDGEASVVISGSIVDGAGTALCELQFAQQTAIEAWEQLLKRWGIDTRPR
jgi:hypothetical protein